MCPSSSKGLSSTNLRLWLICDFLRISSVKTGILPSAWAFFKPLLFFALLAGQLLALLAHLYLPVPLLLLVEPIGLEPITFCVQSRRSPRWAKAPLTDYLSQRFKWTPCVGSLIVHYRYGRFQANSAFSVWRSLKSSKSIPTLRLHVEVSAFGPYL